ncbi:MAG: ABC transporter permease [Myxococcota bacterium]|jgi:putative ABC transport system permease protein|nr:ABC transporter permease [Myxococcota bacterium]
MEVFKMAWRNLWRSRRRSLTTIVAMTFALLVMLLLSGLIEGMLRTLEQDIVELEVGDIQIFADDYRKKPSIHTRILDPESVLVPLDAAGFSASARLLAFGLAASDESSAGASFRGVDVERDARVSRVHREVGEGSWLDENDPKGVVIGKGLARSLSVGLSDEILVLSQAADDTMAYELYRVRGILHSVGGAVDRSGIFMTQPSFRELMVLPEGAHQIIVRRPQGADLLVAHEQVASLASPLEVKTWKMIFPTLSSYLASARSMMSILYLIIYSAVGILLLNSMLMAVFERIQEFGVLKAIGVGPFGVMGLVLMETAIQTGISVACATLLSLPILFFLSTTGINIAALASVEIMGASFNPIWRALFTPGIFVVPILLLVVIVVLAVLYPALKAAWIQPVAAMEHH